MNSRIVAFPGSTSGLEGEIVAHFGHTPAFTAIKFNEENNEIIEVSSIENPPHKQGGCMGPVMLLKDAGVTDVVLGGIGHRPLMGFIQVGIKTFRGVQGTIEQNFKLFTENRLESLETSTCSNQK